MSFCEIFFQQHALFPIRKKESTTYLYPHILIIPPQLPNSIIPIYFPSATYGAPPTQTCIHLPTSLAPSPSFLHPTHLPLPPPPNYLHPPQLASRRTYLPSFTRLPTLPLRTYPQLTKLPPPYLTIPSTILHHQTKKCVFLFQNNSSIILILLFNVSDIGKTPALSLQFF